MRIFCNGKEYGKILWQKKFFIHAVPNLIFWQSNLEREKTHLVLYQSGMFFIFQSSDGEKARKTCDIYKISKVTMM